MDDEIKMRPVKFWQLMRTDLKCTACITEDLISDSKHTALHGETATVRADVGAPGLSVTVLLCDKHYNQLINPMAELRVNIHPVLPPRFVIRPENMVTVLLNNDSPEIPQDAYLMPIEDTRGPSLIEEAMKRLDQRIEENMCRYPHKPMNIHWSDRTRLKPVMEMYSSMYDANKLTGWQKGTNGYIHFYNGGKSLCGPQYTRSNEFILDAASVDPEEICVMCGIRYEANEDEEPLPLDKQKGWATPTWNFANAFDHYFVNGKSLCGRYTTGQIHTDKVLLDERSNPHMVCKICEKKERRLRPIVKSSTD